MSCASPLAGTGPAPEDDRKTVTVVFCDVVGSTSLAEELDPETIRQLIARFFRRMRNELERHGGQVEKFIGDAVMAVFGVPRLHEDDALRAVRAAAEMQQELVRINAQFEEIYGAWFGQNIRADAKRVLRKSADRYLAAISNQLASGADAKDASG